MGNHDPGQAYFSFTLPQEDYGEDMFARRAAPEGSLSPPALQSGQPGGSESTTRRQSSVDDSDGNIQINFGDVSLTNPRSQVFSFIYERTKEERKR